MLSRRIELLGVWCGFIFSCLGLLPTSVSGQISTPVNVTRGAGDWQENPNLRSRMPAATCAHGGYLFGATQTAGDWVAGVCYFDGQITRQGAKLLTGSSYVFHSSLWSDGTNLYAITPGTVKTFTGTLAAGAFVAGELVTQAVSGATGYYIRTDAALGLVVLRASGTFDGTNVITGATGNWTTSAMASPTRYVLQRSATPTDNTTYFLPVLEVKTKIGLPGFFVDCGAIPAPISKQLLLYFSCHNTLSESADIWYNYPADGSTWTNLISVGTAAIEHFHGGQMVRDVNGVGGSHMLLVYTGDANNSSGVLICEDLSSAGGLITAAGTWSRRWALDQVSGAARTAYLTTGAGAPYCLGNGSQRYRWIQAAVEGGHRFLYALPDTQTDTSSNRLQKVDLVSKTVTSLGEPIQGIGWTAATFSNGAMLLLSGSDYSAGAYTGTSDKYLRLWAVGENRDRLYLVWQRERIDSAAPATGSQSYGNIVEFPAGDAANPQPASVWVDGAMGAGAAVGAGGTVCGIYSPRSLGNQTFSSSLLALNYVYPPSMVNLLYNGRFTDGTGLPGAMPNIAPANATISQEATLVDGGNVKSLKVLPAAGATVAEAVWTAPAPVLAAISGQWVTVRCRVLYTAGATQVPRVQAITDNPYTESARNAVLQAAWQTLQFEVFVPKDADNFKIHLIARSAAALENPVYFSDLSLTIGANSGRVPANLPYHTVVP